MSSKDKLLHPVDRQARLTSLSYAGFQDPKVLGNLSDLRAEPALSRGLKRNILRFLPASMIQIYVTAVPRAE